MYNVFIYYSVHVKLCAENACPCHNSFILKGNYGFNLSANWLFEGLKTITSMQCRSMHEVTRKQ